jgi:hypothetical protein
MKTRHAQAGFSLAEMLFAVVLTVIIVSAGTVGYIYLLQGEHLNSTQAGLDINVRTAINALRHDLRLSAMDKIIFYPAGPGPYTAVSFPMTTPNPNGLLNYGTNGLIQWDKTVIYHVWSGQPNQLRVTTFSPRNNTLSDALRQAELSSVVTVGNGSAVANDGTASERALFSNLVQWNIYPQRAIFDGYSSNTVRAVNYDLGTYILTPGSHQFTFTAIGKNALSSNYTIGLDTLVMSPCGVEREAEAQTVATGSATPAYMPNGGWGGNYRLLSSCTATGQYFTLSMENDRWEETNFRGTGAVCDGTTVLFDQTGGTNDFVVQLEGPGYAWQAATQTGDGVGGSSSGDTLRGSAVRVLLRGSEMANGNDIQLDGSMNYVCFMAASNKPLGIVAAYISECSSTGNISVDAAPTNSAQLLFNGTSASKEIPAGSNAWAWSSSKYQVDRDKSYLVSFLVTNVTGHSDAFYWTESNFGTPGCWILPASQNPTPAMTSQTIWSTLSPQHPAQLYAVYGLYTTCPTNGTFTSQIVDTHQTAPTYSDVSWSATVPASASVAMRVRTGNQPDLSDASGWTNVVALSTPGTISPGASRFVQFQAQLRPDSTTTNSPKLRNVTVRWAGVTSAVEVGGTFSKGPDHGIWQLTVDGNPLVKGCSMDLTIYQDMATLNGGTRRMTSTVSMEMYPRNTGK